MEAALTIPSHVEPQLARFERDLLDVEAAARKLCVCRSTLYVMVKRDGVPYVPMPNGMKFRREGLDNWLVERERRNETQTERRLTSVRQAQRRTGQRRYGRATPPPSPHAGTRARLTAS
jgi:hypothetical protein